MSLGVGTRLGPYEVLGAIGAGGMGEVYRARDTRLDRTVAIKVLLPEVSGDPHRRGRLEREARTLATLSHPHVCTLLDVGPHDGSLFLVMEHIEGETLAERLRRGPLPLPQALELAAQIAEGLDAAHRCGVVHRDLKPGNVMLTKAGAKVLDFGLAKLRLDPEVDRAASTETDPLTGAGSVPGTLQYMAPEQLEGSDVDARADIWALGAILYEMAAGQRPFHGDTSARLIAAILEHEPRPLAQVLPIAPPSLDRLVRRCLAKDPADRWESARDLADELRWIVQDLSRGGPEPARRPAPPRWLRLAATTAVGVVVVLGSVAAVMLLGPTAGPEPRPVVRSLLGVNPADEVRSAQDFISFTPTPGGSRTAFSWTPDGRSLVFAGRRGDTQQLFVRSLGADEARPLAGTDGALMPVVSADGRWVAFWADNAIRRVPLAGGPPAVIVDDVGFAPTGMDWGASGLLVYGLIERRDTIWRVRPGSAPEAVTERGKGEVVHVTPHLLPGDAAVVFTVRRRRWSWGDEEVVAQSLATGRRTVLLRNATDVRYLAPGRLLFMRRGTLFAVPFDPVQLEVKGEPVALLDNVAQAETALLSRSITGAAHFAVSPAGDLAYIESPPVGFPAARLVTVDRTGRVDPLAVPSRSYLVGVRLSPDGRKLAVTTPSSTEVTLWVLDLERSTLSRVTPAGAECFWPRWTPDGRQIAYNWEQAGLARQQADGSTLPEVLLPYVVNSGSWSPDGRSLAVVKGGDIWVLDAGGGAGTMQPVVQSPGYEGWPEFSPDGRWLLYASDSSGRFEVYLQFYPGPGPRLQVSVDGGSDPSWNPRGGEIFFVAPAAEPSRRRMMSVAVTLGATAKLGAPRQLFEYAAQDVNLSSFPLACYAVASDGKRFYATQWVKTDPPPPVTHINLVLNWRAELEAKVPSGV